MLAQVAGWLVEGLRLAFAGTAGVAIFSVVAYLARDWIFERLKQGIKYEYDVKLEAFRADLQATNARNLAELQATSARQASESNAAAARQLAELRSAFDQRLALQSAATAALTSMHNASSAKRIDAVQELWGILLRLKRNFPPIV